MSEANVWTNEFDSRGEQMQISSAWLGDRLGTKELGVAVHVLDPGASGFHLHAHFRNEELFVVLEGDGVLKLWPSPQQARRGTGVEEHAVRAGSVVSRLPGTGIAHSFHAGAHGMKLLAYGQRQSGDYIYYPRSNKVFFRGVGLIARLEDLDYSDGEPA